MSVIVLFEEFYALLTIVNILLLLASTMAGIIIGALPGLTATMGVALLTGITFGMQRDMAIIVLMGVYVGAIYGGSLSAVLIGIPGTGSAAATVLDGYPLARKGLATTALSLATLASFIGTLIGMVCLAAFTPLIERLALKFTSSEFSLLAIFGVTICGSLTATGSKLKGWIAGIIGLTLSCIGMESMYAYPRFAYENPNLFSGIAFVPAMIGLFGVPSILDELANRGAKAQSVKIGSEKTVGILSLLRGSLGNIVRSGLIGVGVGAIPGVGEDVAAWLAYDRAKKSSKTPEKFGHGSYDGVVAAETANNAAIGGAIIPLLTLAIPGSAGTAVLLGALQLHGVRPGPMLSFEFPRFIPYMSAVLLLAAIMMRVCALPACKFAPKVLTVPVHILMPVVAVISCIGSYALNISHFDIFVMVAFGIVGYVLYKLRYPAAPVVLGLILGPIADSNLRRLLKFSDGSLLPMVTRPISLIIVFLIVWTVLNQLGVIGKVRMRASESIRLKMSKWR